MSLRCGQSALIRSCFSSGRRYWSRGESAGDRITELVTFSHHCQAATTSGHRKNIGKNTGRQRNQVLIGFVMHEQPLHYGQAGGSETLRW